jgi:hypothetical protein
MTIQLSKLVRLVPEAARDHLPAGLRKFRVSLMPWLSQIYYDDRLIHYELVKLPPRFGENRLEIGLHFESKDRELNLRLLAGFSRHLFDIRAALNDDWWAEIWDRGWTKVYTTMHYTRLDEELVSDLGQRMARSITVLHPIYQSLR